MHSIDIEDALRLAITDSNLTATAPPLPPSFSVPYCLVMATGGDTSDMVLDRLGATVHVYAATWADAQAKAEYALARVRAKEGDFIGTAARGRSFVYRVEADSLPYHNPDPERNDLARWTFNLSIYVRAI